MLLFIILFLIVLILLSWDVQQATVEKSIEIIQFNTDNSICRIKCKVLIINRHRFIIWEKIEGKQAKHFELTIYRNDMIPKVTRIETSDKSQYIYIDS